MRLIDADDLDEKGIEFTDTNVYVPIEAIWNAPTIEAEPVVHGEWVRPTMINGVNFDIPHCSVCETVPCDEGKYCPNCGASMTRGKTDE